MTFQQKILIVTALAAVIGLAVGPKRRSAFGAGSGFAAGSGAVAMWLAVVAGALIVVGFVSHTIVRHLIQIAPFVVALALVMRGSGAGASAAAPLFAFWVLVMGAIWLFLLGVARIFSGTFTPVEVGLTIVIGVGSMLGLATTWRRGTAASWGVRVVTVITFAVMQLGAMWLSVQPYFATR
jgi:hypothetical protein